MRSLNYRTAVPAFKYARRGLAGTADGGSRNLHAARRRRHRRARPRDPHHHRGYRDREDEGASRDQLGQRDHAPALAALPRIREPDMLEPG